MPEVFLTPSRPRATVPRTLYSCASIALRTDCDLITALVLRAIFGPNRAISTVFHTVTRYTIFCYIVHRSITTVMAVGRPLRFGLCTWAIVIDRTHFGI